MVRETVDRLEIRTQRARPTPYEPRRSVEWTGTIAALTRQLRDEQSVVAREHWGHHGLYDQLVEAVAALGRAHPGGLDRLARRR